MAPKVKLVYRAREKDDLCPVLYSYITLKNLEQEHRGIFSPHGESVFSKEDIKEQPTPRNLSATARRVLQCTWSVAASRKYFSAIGALYCCQCSE
jgi:hypothetical protein